MNKTDIKKSRDAFIKCAARARKHNDKEKEKQFISIAVTLNNLLHPNLKRR